MLVKCECGQIMIGQVPIQKKILKFTCADCNTKEQQRKLAYGIDKIYKTEKKEQNVISKIMKPKHTRANKGLGWSNADIDML